MRQRHRTVHIPWEALIHVDTKYALTLYTPGHKYPVWAAPAPGTAQHAARHPQTRRKGRVGRPSVEDTRAPPGRPALHRVGRRRRGRAPPLGASCASAARSRPGIADATPVTVRWHVASLVGMTLLAAGTVAALLLA